MTDICSYLDPVIDREKIKDAKIEVVGKNDKGDGYLGIVSAVNVRGDNKTLKLILKTAPPGEELRKLTPIRNCYVTEINFYTKVYPILRKCQLDCGDIRPFINIAKCYGTCLKDNAEGLVMENLKEAGFSVCERRITMSKEHVIFALEEYGRFHAMSYALREKQPKIFKDLTYNMADNFVAFLYSPDFQGVFGNILDRIAQIPEIKKDTVGYASFLKFKQNYVDILKGMKSQNADKFAVITHGDCWTNNMMFRYDDVTNPNIPTSMRLIDWQLQKLSSPTSDISYFLYACTDKAIFDNLDTYLKIYHRSLTAQLEKLGCNCNYLSFVELKDQYKKYSKYGVLFSFLVIKLMLSDSDEVPDIAEAAQAEGGNNFMEVFNFKTKNEDKYIARVTDLVLHGYKYKLF